MGGTCENLLTRLFGEPCVWSTLGSDSCASVFLQLEWSLMISEFLPSSVSDFGAVLSSTSVSGMADVRHSTWTQDSENEYLNSASTEGDAGTPWTAGTKPKG